MRLIDPLIVRLHRRVKRSRLLRVALHPVWQLMARGWLLLRGVLRPSVPPPVGYVTSVSEWLRRLGPSRHDVFHSVVHPEQPVSHDPPNTIEDHIHWKFSTARKVLPPATVTVIPSGRVWGPGTAVITPDNLLIGELSKALCYEDYVERPQDHPIFAKTRLEAPYNVNGKLAVLSAPGGAGYYHWMVDSLPRLLMLERAGFDVMQFEYYLVNAFVAQFHHDTFALLKIPRNRVIESHWQPHVVAEEVVFPSLPGAFGNVPRWVCDFLRATFLGEVTTPTTGSSGTHLYLTREKATHRKVTNEEELRSTVLREFDFEVIAIESLAVKEQARIMSEASVVCGPHGAGLTNIVFCRPGTRVIEFLNPGDMSYVYWTLACQAELTYWYLVGEGDRPRGAHEPHLSMHDITVNVDALRKTLSACCA